MAKKIKAFTLVELLVVVTLIIILAVLLLIALNPWTQVKKSHDGKRKNDLATLGKVLEDWYNDKQCYPKPSEICYDAPDVMSKTCHICGTEIGSPSFTPYLSTMVCDPNFPAVKYLYNYDDADCPTLYRIFTALSITTDAVIEEIGCTDGCGPSLGYNYGVSSPDTGLVVQQFSPTNTPTPTIPTQGYCTDYPSLYYRPEGTSDCNICGSYENCKIIAPGMNYYIDGGDPDPNNRCKIGCIKN
ncbi:hypothetical protein HZA76_01780 [Candidatus Roizmanbacteria bacterium]|nr:hypothetical protein [Candidatus Roizmanbacteria bacterium]